MEKRVSGQLSWYVTVVLFVFILFHGVFLYAKERNDLNDKKILLIIPSSDFNDEEYKVVREILEKRGAEITVAASKKTPAAGMFQKITVTPDILLNEAEASSFDAVVFIGGAGAEEYFDDKTAHEIAKKAMEENKVLAAICLAPSILANAGVLKDKKATVFETEKGNLKSKGAICTSAGVEVSGNIVTGKGQEASKKFAEKIVDLLKSRKLQGKSFLMIIAVEKFRDEELKEPKELFEKLGGKVSVASTEKKKLSV
ncbi:MAG: DJ-1/PfpI family protein [Planctomycetota bacterium]